MNERDEINLRLAQRDSQAKQDSSGVFAMGMCVVAAGAGLYFMSAPSSQSAVILAFALVALLLACARMLTFAAKVVEARSSLQPVPIRPVRIDSVVIDAEVVESPRPQEFRKLPRYI